jgi:hypothetical protein
MTAASATNPFAATDFENKKARRLVFNKWLMFSFCAVLVIHPPGHLHQGGACALT